MKLNLGCGGDYRDGYVNVDKYQVARVDQIVDLEDLPWPWETNSVQEVILKHVLEHLGQAPNLFLKIIKELYRVCRPGADVHIEVPHPLHSDYLGDPTHCRPITAESLFLFNRRYADYLIARGAIGTPLAKYLDVDFNMLQNLEFRDQAGNLQVNKFHLKVIKPIKVSFMSRGMGDCLMGLCVAHALTESGYRVSYLAPKIHYDMIRACPHVYELTEDKKDEKWLGASWYQLQRTHQVDIALKTCGLPNAPNRFKSLELQIPQEIEDQIGQLYPGTDRIVIHPAGVKPVRTWPLERWKELVMRLQADGLEVVSIGVAEWGAPPIEGIPNEYSFTPFETMALLKHAKLLISADSGPIQFAGMSECGILGLYSVVNPEWRLPYRHGELGWNCYGIKTKCSHAPCYWEMVTGEYGCLSGKTRGIYTGSMEDLVSRWCLNSKTPFGCMHSITVDEVYQRAIDMYGAQPMEYSDNMSMEDV